MPEELPGPYTCDSLRMMHGVPYWVQSALTVASALEATSSHAVFGWLSAFTPGRGRGQYDGAFHIAICAFSSNCPHHVADAHRTSGRLGQKVVYFFSWVQKVVYFPSDNSDLLSSHFCV
jgi:hypothetical protein